MQRTDSRLKPTMDGSAIYRIRVRGILEFDQIQRLGGMNVTFLEEEGVQESIIVGRLADQAALTGVLNTLYACHFPVLSVDCLESD